MLLNQKMSEALETLKAVAQQNVTNNKLKANVEKITKNRVPIGKTEDLLNKDLRVEVYFSKVEIYWMMKAFYLETGIRELNVEKHFSPIEISKYENYLIEEGIQTSVITLNNVMEVVPNTIYHCYKCDFKDISLSYRNGITTYNYETQRQSQLTMKGGEIIESPTIIQKNVEGIQDSMRKGDYTPNTITWNILDNGLDECSYNPETHQLTLVKTKDSHVNVIDGYHRTMAIDNLVSKQETVSNDFMYITILRYSVEKAQKYIKQEQQGTKLSVAQQKNFINDNAIVVAKQINMLGAIETNALYNQIANNEEEVTKFETKLISLELVADILRQYYDKHMITQRSNRKVAEWIVEFMNEVYGIYYKDFEDRRESQKTRVITYPNILGAFIGFSEKIYNDKELQANWQIRLEKTLEKIDMNISNDIFKEIPIKSKRGFKASKKGIEKLIEILTDEYRKIK